MRNIQNISKTQRSIFFAHSVQLDQSAEFFFDS